MQQLKISNLPRWISEIHLKQFFSNCGTIVQANIALDEHTLRPLGYGYITFNDEMATDKALQKNGSLLDGATITVEMTSHVEAEALIS